MYYCHVLGICSIPNKLRGSHVGDDPLVLIPPRFPGKVPSGSIEIAGMRQSHVLHAWLMM